MMRPIGTTPFLRSPSTPPQITVKAGEDKTKYQIATARSHSEFYVLFQ